MLVAGDFNGDGKLDLASHDPATDLRAAGQRRRHVPGPGNDRGGSRRTGLWWRAISTVTAGSTWPSPARSPTTVSVLLGNGDGTFADPGQLATTPHATPLVADVNGDGTDDVLVVDGAGDILYRQGIPGHPGTFDPPVTINPGFPSRDIAWVPNTDQGPVLASVDARDDAVSLYAWRDGGFVRLGSLATGRLPAQIIAADLNGDGWTDLVVRNAGDGTLSVFFGTEFIGASSSVPSIPRSFLRASCHP